MMCNYIADTTPLIYMYSIYNSTPTYHTLFSQSILLGTFFRILKFPIIVIMTNKSVLMFFSFKLIYFRCIWKLLLNKNSSSISC